MGGGQSKEEALKQALSEDLFAAVRNSNHQTLRSLRQLGASLEWTDKDGRTPLILACTRVDLYDMVITLLDEGARLDAYRRGASGGNALHHAAKRGLDQTVILLISRGADPLAVNDDGQTPLTIARKKSHVSVVRTIEASICLFSGMMRELTGPGFLEYLAPQYVTKNIWVVVLPMQSDPRKPSSNVVAIYQSYKVAMPRTLILLAKAEVGGPKLEQHDPTVLITATDKTARVKFRFKSENEGDKAQLERFYHACARGIRQVNSGPPASPALSVANTPSTSQSIPAPSSTSGHSTTTSSNSLALIAAPSSTATAPSAPTLALHGPIHYPSVDTSPAAQLNWDPVKSAPVAEASSTGGGTTNKLKGEERPGGQCVICWDAPAEAVCIPCGHIAGCMDCLPEVKSKNWGCPVCRAPIQQVFKVFAV